ncbi:MAG: BACON domain-containing protein, partial [Candidatus Cryptobacteroides sp.]
MKNIFKSFLTLASVAAVFASCVQQAKPLASSVSLDKEEVVFEGQNAPAQTVTVKADGDWFAVAPEWVTLEPTVGSGETEVKVSVADNLDEWNELAGPRSASVSFCYGTTGLCVLSVQQNGENGLDASRQYSKITTAEEFAAGPYLVVFNYNGKDNALKAFNATSESTYSYLYGDEVTVVDGIVNMPNANNAYTFEAAEGGYKIKMPNGRYLFQSANYNNFYSSDDVAKGDVWTVTFDETGLATIKNVTTADKWMQWTSYGNAGAYSSAQDGGVLPMLYKDSKPASDEILTVPENVSVASNATTATIAVSSNKTWKVRCHDEWITELTKEGEGNGEIVLKFTANESKTDARSASIQVIGETTN